MSNPNPPAEAAALPVSISSRGSAGLLLDTEKFDLAVRGAKLLSSSDLVPKNYQGHIANCVLALHVADGMGMDPFMVMQELNIIHGRPSFSAKMVIALINTKGPFIGSVKFRFDGEGDARSCTAYAKHADDGEIVEQTVTIKNAKDEGWFQKSGSKWQTIPDLMLQYRSAAWLGRVYCPEVLMGMQTTEEVEDVFGDSQYRGPERAKDVSPPEDVVEPEAPAEDPSQKAPETPEEAPSPKEEEHDPETGELAPEPDMTEEPVENEAMEPEPEAEEPNVRRTRKGEYNRIKADLSELQDVDAINDFAAEEAETITWIGEAAPKFSLELNELISDKLSMVDQ
jgi:hypothetical protein